MKKYNTSICLIIRDENEYLKEWVDYHLAIGFEHIYIYDHKSEAPVLDFINNEFNIQTKKKITLIKWNQKFECAQSEAYKHFLDVFKSQTKWVAFIDVDEFIKMHNCNDINKFLLEYDNIRSFFIYWCIFGADAQQFKLPGGVMDRFKKPVELDLLCMYKFPGKVIVQTDYITNMQIHLPDYKDNIETFDESFSYPIGGYHINKIQLNHYYTRSYEEWVNKIKRGTCDPLFRKELREFFLFNPDMAELDNGINMEQEYRI